MRRETFIVQTVDWLNRRVAPAGVVVDADTRLFERGVVDSLGILKLIAWTEKAIGRRIGDREIRMDRFGSVRAIAESFAESGDAAESRFAAEGGVAAERFAESFAGSAATRRGACSRCGGCALRAAGASTGTSGAPCPRRAA